MSGRNNELTQGLTPQEQAELQDLTGVEQRLTRYVSPDPSADDTARLLAHLRPLVAARALPAAELEPTHGLRHWLGLAWSQTALLEPAFWWVGGIIFVLGLLLALLDLNGTVPLVLALASPLLAVGAVAYAFRPEARSTLELEQTLPINPLELLYARLGLVLTGNLAMSLALLAVVWLGDPRWILWRMAIIWQGPMLALAGLALYATVRWGAILGAALPLLAWAGLIGSLAHSPEGTGMYVLISRVLPAVQTSGGLLLGAVAALLLGLGLIWQAGRWAVGDGAAWS